MDIANTKNLKVGIDSSGVKKGAKEMERAVDKSTDRMTQDIKKTGSALKALSASFLAAFSIGAVTAFTTSSIGLYRRQEQSIRQLEARIKSTGGAAGFSVEQFDAMATSLQTLTVFGDEAINEMHAMLGTFTEIRGPQFKGATIAVLDLATALGTDLTAAALQVGKALNDPILGVSALGRAGIQFTQIQKEQIKVMVASGRITEAQNLVLAEFNKQMGGSAIAAAAGTGKILQMQNAVGDASEVFGKWIFNLEITQKAIDGIRNAADLLAGNVSMRRWAERASEPMKLLAFLIKTTVLEFEELGQKIGGYAALIGNADSLPEMIKNWALGREDNSAFGRIIDDMRANRERMEKERDEFMQMLMGNQGMEPRELTPQEVYDSIVSDGSGAPRNKRDLSPDQKRAAAAAAKAQEQLEAYTAKLKEQVDTFGLSENAMMLYNTQQEVMGREHTKAGQSALALTEELVKLKEAEREREETAKKALELQARANSLLDSTLTPLDRYKRLVVEINELREKGIFTEEEYQKVLIKSQDDLAEAMDSADSAIEERLRSIENATNKFGDKFLDTMIGAAKGTEDAWKDMAKAMIEDIARIVTKLTVIEPAVRAITEAIRESQEESSGGGILGTLFGAVGKIFSPNSGGGGDGDTASGELGFEDILPEFAVGSPRIPRDMVAKVHKDEMILDPGTSNALRRYGIGANAGSTTPSDERGVSIVYNIDARGASAGVDAKIRQAMKETELRTIARLRDGRRRRRGT